MVGPCRTAKRIGLLLALSSAIVAKTTSLASAQGTSGRFTQEEFRRLPRACLAQGSINKALVEPVVSETERDQWARTMGESYKHYHHYCWGLLDMRRGAANVGNNQHYYSSAVDNFQYVIRNSTPDFPLLPEVYLRKGLALRFLARDAESAAEFLSALRIKPDYTPAYAALIELYQDLGDLESARATLETGLRNAPRSKILEQKRAELYSNR